MSHYSTSSSVPFPLCEVTVPTHHHDDGDPNDHNHSINIMSHDDGDDDWRSAVKRGDLEALQRILASSSGNVDDDPASDAAAEGTTTLLHAAAAAGHVHVLRWLVQEHYRHQHPHDDDDDDDILQRRDGRGRTALDVVDQRRAEIFFRRLRAADPADIRTELARYDAAARYLMSAAASSSSPSEHGPKMDDGDDDERSCTSFVAAATTSSSTTTTKAMVDIADPFGHSPPPPNALRYTSSDEGQFVRQGVVQRHTQLGGDGGDTVSARPPQRNEQSPKDVSAESRSESSHPGDATTLAYNHPSATQAHNDDNDDNHDKKDDHSSANQSPPNHHTGEPHHDADHNTNMEDRKVPLSVPDTIQENQQEGFSQTIPTPTATPMMPDDETNQQQQPDASPHSAVPPQTTRVPSALMRSFTEPPPSHGLLSAVERKLTRSLHQERSWLWKANHQESSKSLTDIKSFMLEAKRLQALLDATSSEQGDHDRDEESTRQTNSTEDHHQEASSMTHEDIGPDAGAMPPGTGTTNNVSKESLDSVGPFKISSYEIDSLIDKVRSEPDQEEKRQRPRGGGVKASDSLADTITRPRSSSEGDEKVKASYRDILVEPQDDNVLPVALVAETLTGCPPRHEEFGSERKLKQHDSYDEPQSKEGHEQAQPMSSLSVEVGNPSDTVALDTNQGNDNDDDDKTCQLRTEVDQLRAQTSMLTQELKTLREKYQEKVALLNNLCGIVELLISLLKAKSTNGEAASLDGSESLDSVNLEGLAGHLRQHLERQKEQLRRRESAE